MKQMHIGIIKKKYLLRLTILCYFASAWNSSIIYYTIVGLLLYNENIGIIDREMTLFILFH